MYNLPNNITQTDLNFIQDIESWIDSPYVLVLQLADGFPSTSALLDFIRTLWEVPYLKGPFPSRFFTELDQLMPIEDNLIGIMSYGLISLPEQPKIGCTVKIVFNNNCTWGILSIPTPMLQRLYPLENVIFDRSLPWGNWTDEVDTLLAYWSSIIYQKYFFKFGMVGEDIFALKGAHQTLTLREVNQESNLLLSKHLFVELNIESRGLLLTEDLWWTGHWSSRLLHL